MIAATHMAMAAFNPAQVENLMIFLLFLTGSAIVVGLEIDRFRVSELNKIILQDLASAKLQMRVLQRRDQLLNEHLKSYTITVQTWNSFVINDASNQNNNHRRMIEMMQINLRHLMQIFTYLSEN